MSAPIDIFTYPENATPLEMARYQVAVMEAAERGDPAEFTSDFYHYKEWFLITARHEKWAWGLCRYRIARPKIAEGHNPDKLTEAQVGVKDGWRLLSKEEVATCRQSVWPDTDWFRDGEWTDDSGGYYCSHPNSLATLRTKKPPGHYLPKPAAEPVAEVRPGQTPIFRAPDFEPREETRRDRIATIVQLIRTGNETADQIAARIEALLARETSPVSWRAER